MKYKYKLKQSSYYTGNGCSCCEPYHNEIWEITRIDEDDNESIVYIDGTPYSLEDCYEAILNDLNIEIDIEYEEN